MMNSRRRLSLKILGIIATALSGAAAQDTDEESTSWTISAGARYLSRYTAYGADLGSGQAALGYQLGLDHASGLSVGAGTIQTLGSDGILQHWSVDLGYTWQALDWLALSAEYSHYEYANDSANVLAPLTNSISIGLDTELGSWGLGLSYDAYLGTNTASYISADLSSAFVVGDLIIVPLAQATFMSQTIEDRLLKSISGKGSSGGSKGSGGGGSGTTTSITTLTSTITGLSSVSAHVVLAHPIVGGLSVSFHPYFLYSPKSELSTSNSQFLWSASVR